MCKGKRTRQKLPPGERILTSLYWSKAERDVYAMKAREMNMTLSAYLAGILRKTENRSLAL